MPKSDLKPDDDEEKQETGDEKNELYEPKTVPEEIEESNIARVDIITGEKKITMSAPVKEFEELKNSFKNMMTAFGNFIEAAGLEMGKDETSVKMNTLLLEMEQLKDELRAETADIRKELVPQNDFEEYKAASELREAKASEDYVRRSEFEKFRQTVRDAI